MAQAAPEWIWDAAHNDYYYVQTDSYGRHTYIFSRQQAAAAAASQVPAPSSSNQLSGNHGYGHNRRDSATQHNPLQPQYIEDGNPRQLLPFIRGTPQNGAYEPLDESFRMRTGAEARQFFKPGKVLSMLHTQAASRDVPDSNSCITYISFGERAFSQIRRFIVVEARSGFVYACPISTYSKRGTTKPGCNPYEHAIAYFRGTRPTLVMGETALPKDPIAIVPADPNEVMHPASRVQFGKVYPIECNVKVKDIGDVAPEDMARFLLYYREENRPDQSDPQPSDTYLSPTSPSTYSASQHQASSPTTQYYSAPLQNYSTYQGQGYPNDQAHNGHYGHLGYPYQ
ncbi:hypothetical protein BS50DRAFT_630385 [Corynespora cassiicola Philippines]|uniref:DUF6590 domain-containing protein n=1 Tax=Corynespora cassiicola Philippines TaxID=1448308 RepID=A0A2T2P491_CORCC|nr:hypothetical protein BS50DRAFT_630385 [Corynespora cassiicola Philippines]